MAEFTPGPWTVSPEAESLSFSVYDADETSRIADVCRFAGNLESEAEANARLIAAAPALYAALEEMTKVVQRYDSESISQSQFFNMIRNRADDARAALALVSPKGD